MLVVVKQLVIHQQTCRQKTDIGSRMDRGENQIAAPDNPIGARREPASLRHKYGWSLIPGGERRQMVAKAALAKVFLRAKWDLG